MWRVILWTYALMGACLMFGAAGHMFQKPETLRVKPFIRYGVFLLLWITWPVPFIVAVVEFWRRGKAER